MPRPHGGAGGDLAAAARSAEAAPGDRRRRIAGALVRAEVAGQSGRLEEADQGYKSLVDYYNAHDIQDVEQLRWIGLAAAKFARWNRLTDQFRFLVNDLYPDALKIDPAWWPAHYQAGVLYLEKYNHAEAARELKAAVKQNPNAAEVHAASRLAVQNFDLGTARQATQRALEINPTNLEAQLALGDILLANFQAVEAIPVFQQACRLHPASEAAQGRLAAAYGVVDGVKEDLDGTRVGQLIAQATTRTSTAASSFFHSPQGWMPAESFHPRRWFREATERMPQLIEPYGDLGIVLMRLGEESEAKQQLEKAFAIDPFNVRVNNMLKVLEVLDTYAVLETEHFVIRFDRGRDEILAEYAARYLEEDVYPELCQRFGFRPQEKSLFEIFSRAATLPGTVGSAPDGRFALRPYRGGLRARSSP